MAAAMKFIVVVGLVPHAVARLQASDHSEVAHHHRSLALTAGAAPGNAARIPEGEFDKMAPPEADHQSEAVAPSPPSRPRSGTDKAVHYGDTTCPCIGFDNIDGETMLEIEVQGKMMEVAYPADMGARCAAWDDDRLMKCTGPADQRANWCAQKWCYVDPCNCDIDVLPKVASMYNTEATYRGKPLFWSYATCGGKDEFTQKLPKLGRPQCRCIGFAGVAGTTEISMGDGKMVEYPADLGSTCHAWDDKVRPDCSGENAPSWCRANWCYVDPCECDLPGGTVPKISAYLTEATFTGKNIYYSYETCGNADTFTENNHDHACVNQMTQDDCSKEARCSWTGSRCLGSELVSHPLCKEAARKVMNEKSGSASYELSLVGFSTLLIATLAAI